MYCTIHIKQAIAVASITIYYANTWYYSPLKAYITAGNDQESMSITGNNIFIYN